MSVFVLQLDLLCGRNVPALSFSLSLSLSFVFLVHQLTVRVSKFLYFFPFVQSNVPTK